MGAEQVKKMRQLLRDYWRGLSSSLGVQTNKLGEATTSVREAFLCQKLGFF
jgi:hypothetical protein